MSKTRKAYLWVTRFILNVQIVQRFQAFFLSEENLRKREKNKNDVQLSQVL